MKFRKRYVPYFFLTALLLFLVYAFYRVQPYIEIQMSDARLAELFAAEPPGAVEIGYAEGPSRDLRYVRIGFDTTKPLLVFVHGSPSSSAWWLDMLNDTKLREMSNLLAIDRPGYGGSGLGLPMTDVREQAENVAAVIRQQRANDQRIVVHGSSYGGTVSARLAMDFPSLVDGLLLQSASTAPDQEYTYWLTHPTSHWSLKWLIPRGLRTANSEKLAHLEQLEAMRGGWKNIDAPTVILHGTDDWLIFPRNAYYSCEKLVNAPRVVHHMIEDGEHDLLKRTPGLLRQYLYRLVRGTP